MMQEILGTVQGALSVGQVPVNLRKEALKLLTSRRSRANDNKRSQREKAKPTAKKPQETKHQISKQKL